MTAPDMPSTALSSETVRRLRALTDRFTDIGAAERANYQLYLTELCEAIGVEKPRPASADPAEHTAYQFEFPVKSTSRDGTVSTNYIDLFKAGCFALEAKDSDDGASTGKLLTKAFGQVVNYARDLAERPPYIMVLDVGKTLTLWDRWQGTYGGFHLGTRIDLRTLADRPDDVALLRDIWTDPGKRDPRRYAQAITVEIAGLLGELAKTLEERGEDPERVARFLIRCVFSMFAEDVKLLPNKAFTRLLDAVLDEPPERFVEAAEDLWKAMDAGSRFGYDRILRFNGHFFAGAEALPLRKAELQLLRRASAADWSAVEPSIFGTLLVRALSAEERHRLGAEYTPRAFIERLVRPTVEEPVRERWTAVQAEVLQLRERGRAVDLRAAESRLLEFHTWLRGLRILDPACGSGNFLYVTMHVLKRVEVEVFRLLSEVQGGQISTRMDEIDPGQFHGIEVKAWAREIAELTLWIGFHQFWKQQHGDVQPQEPLLRDTGTIECRDAVLAWDEIVHRPEKDRPDPTPRIVHPVTGQLVPDPAAKLPYYEYVGARQAEWPEADFIVGNPPYLGEKRQREVLGEGYVDALRSAYAPSFESADLVTYWWFRAAERVASKHTIRMGMITTNTIVQAKNRFVIRNASDSGAHVVWAIANHPWVDSSADADVRVTMSVLANSPPSAVSLLVADDGSILKTRHSRRLNADLSAHADVPTAALTRLNANRGLCFQGYKLGGSGFVCSDDEARSFIDADPRNGDVIRVFRNGRDVGARPRNAFVIDFGLKEENEAREFPLLFDRVRDLVKPLREANSRESYARLWWRFVEPRRELREALAGLPRFFVTVEVSKYRFFTALGEGVAPDGALIAVASADGFVLGVLSSLIHCCWSIAAGGKMGVGNDPRYNKSLCFDPFPFPVAASDLALRIAAVAERLDAHRKSAIARDERVTMTGMYNVVTKLRTGEALTPKERAIHEIAACGVLRDIHDELDALVAEAYGWRWPMPDDEILERLVALHNERVEEEKRGIIRWLRPEYQAPGQSTAVPEADLDLLEAAEAVAAPAAAPMPWPADAVEQIGALKRLVLAAPLSVDEATARFIGARREIVARHLETLAILGEVRSEGDRYASAVSA